MNGRTCLLIGSCALLLLLASSAAAADDASTPPSGGASAVILFERLDRNGDGQLTADEVPAGRRALFDRLLQTADADKDGKLSRDEFAAGLESKRPERPVSEKLPERNPAGGAGIDPDRVFSRFDRNGDGKIVAGEVPDEARGIFERLLVRADKNGDGELTKQELVDAANQLKPPAAGKPGQMDPAKIFDYLDGNADGKLSADEIPDGRPMLQMLLKRGDRDGDGALSREEFMAGFAALRAAQEGEKPAANTPTANRPTANRRTAGPLGGISPSDLRKWMPTATARSAARSLMPGSRPASPGSTPTATATSSRAKSGSGLRPGCSSGPARKRPPAAYRPPATSRLLIRPWIPNPSRNRPRSWSQCRPRSLTTRPRSRSCPRRIFGSAHFRRQVRLCPFHESLRVPPALSCPAGGEPEPGGCV